MTVLVYLMSTSLECYSLSMDLIIKKKQTRDRNRRLELFCKKGIFKDYAKFTEDDLFGASF